jgi:hypothetical protein
MKSADFLDAVKARHGLSTDYQLGKFLRWPQARVSMYRTGKRELDDAACVQIAAALDVPAPYVLACIAAQRAKSAAIKKHWEAAAKLLKTGTAAAIVAATLAVSQFAPSPARAAEVRLTQQPMHYAPRRRGADRRRRWRPRRRKLRTVTADAN